MKIIILHTIKYNMFTSVPDFASTQLDQDVVLDINFIHASTPVTPGVYIICFL